jgi:hypothetical protein
MACTKAADGGDRLHIYGEKLQIYLISSQRGGKKTCYKILHMFLELAHYCEHGNEHFGPTKARNV